MSPWTGLDQHSSGEIQLDFFERFQIKTVYFVDLGLRHPNIPEKLIEYGLIVNVNAECLTTGSDSTVHHPAHSSFDSV